MAEEEESAASDRSEVTIKGDAKTLNDAFSQIKLKPDCTTLIKGMTILVKLSGQGTTDNTDVKVRMGNGEFKRMQGKDLSQIYYGSHSEKILNQ